MGGRGSGRRLGVRQPCCEDYQAIDLAWLRRKGLLFAGRASTLSRFGHPTASLKLTARRDGVQLAYFIVGDDGERESISEVVAFVETPTARGGSRKWFRCNGCGKGCRILYSGQYFRCRSCHRLRCASQYVPGYQRTIYRANKLRELLGDKVGSVFNGVPYRANLCECDGSPTSVWKRSTTSSTGAGSRKSRRSLLLPAPAEPGSRALGAN